MLNKAIKIATKYHEGQTYGDNPYTYHLGQVANIVHEYGDDAKIIAWLHDTIEDTDYTSAEMDSDFGSFISTCVYYLTDEYGSNRKERKAKTHAKLKKVNEDLYDMALIVKTADRLANVRGGKKNDMYQKEHEAFKDAVYREGLCDEIWEEIDEILNKDK